LGLPLSGRRRPRSRALLPGADYEYDRGADYEYDCGADYEYDCGANYQHCEAHY
jgi:hypothetical protein